MTTTFQITSGDLKAFMLPLLKAAGKDSMLPVLCAVHLRGIDGTLVGESTDRFRAAFHRHRPEKYDGGDFGLLLPTVSVKRLLAVFGAAGSTFLTITATAESMTVTDHQTTLTVLAMPGEFPNVASLIATAVKADEPLTTTFGVNYRHLGDIAASIPGTRPGTCVVRAPRSGKGPAFFQLTDDLLVMVMPRRNREDDEWSDPSLDLSSWANLLGAS